MTRSILFKKLNNNTQFKLKSFTAESQKLNFQNMNQINYRQQNLILSLKDRQDIDSLQGYQQYPAEYHMPIKKPTDITINEIQNSKLKFGPVTNKQTSSLKKLSESFRSNANLSKCSSAMNITSKIGDDDHTNKNSITNLNIPQTPTNNEQLHQWNQLISKDQIDILNINYNHKLVNLLDVDSNDRSNTYQDQQKELFEDIKYRERGSISIAILKIEQIISNKDQNVKIEGSMMGNSSMSDTFQFQDLQILHNCTDEAKIQGIMKVDIGINNSSYYKKLPNRNVKNGSCQFILYGNQFWRKKLKKQYLSTTNVIDLAIPNDSKYKSLPLLDPMHIQLTLEDYQCQGVWMSSSCNTDNEIYGEIVRVRNNGVTLFNQYICPWVVHDVEMKIIVGLLKVRSNDLLTVVLVKLARQLQTGKVLHSGTWVDQIKLVKEKVGMIHKGNEEKISEIDGMLDANDIKDFRRKLDKFRN